MNKWEIKIYQAKAWNTEIQVKLENETVWLKQIDMQSLFWRDQSVISRHINNVFKENELDKKSNMQKMHIANSDKPVILYSLDVIISVWYRVKSQEWTQFRIWANKILKEYLIKWYSVNKNRLQEKWYKELEQTIGLFKKTLKSWNLSKDESIWLLDIITNYTNTWLLLQNYDEDNLLDSWNTKKLDYKLEAEEAFESLSELKQNLLFKNEATDLFAKLMENDWLKGIFWNIYQTFWWNDLYWTVEEKAANLLYFIIKDHPFTDWNKRSWAFLFILFLAKNHILFDKNLERKINDRALVAITLLIAESNPKDKEIMVKLVINLIN